MSLVPGIESDFGRAKVQTGNGLLKSTNFGGAHRQKRASSEQLIAYGPMRRLTMVPPNLVQA